MTNWIGTCGVTEPMRANLCTAVAIGLAGLTAGCVGVHANRWEVVQKVSLSQVGHVMIPANMNQACSAFRLEVLPMATRDGSTGFSASEPDFAPLLKGQSVSWTVPRAHTPIVECDYTARSLSALPGMEVSEKNGTFVAAVYLARDGSWEPAAVDWND